MSLVLIDCKRSHAQVMGRGFHDGDTIVSAMLRERRV